MASPSSSYESRKKHAGEQIRSLDTSLEVVRSLAKDLRADMETMSDRLRSLEAQQRSTQTAIVKTLTFLFTLLDDPDAKAHAAAVVKDYNLQNQNQT